MLATQSLNHHHPYPPVPYSSASTTAAYASSAPLAAMSMYTMQQQQHHHHQQSPYGFTQAPHHHHHHHQQQQQTVAAAPAPRQYGSQGTSSAFSASANPDEDWTKISDLAERRRIQNRIAQRNYRKKLKRRLEDLERRAGSPDSTESQKPSPSSKSNKRTPAAATTKAQKAASQKQQPKMRQASTSPAAQSPPSVTVAPQPTKPVHMPHVQFTPPMDSSDEFIMPSQYDDGRDPSHSPPPMYSASASAASSYSSYPPPDELLLNPYSAASTQAYPTMVTTDGGYTSYLTTASAAPSTTIPPMTHFTDAFKQRDSYGSDGYGGGYGFYTSMDVNGSSPYESNPHTPPLSHTFDHSANCSESGYEYPTTPLSMPGSPAMVQQL